MMRSTSLTRLLLAGTALAGIATAAQAQTPPATPQPVAEKSDTAPLGQSTLPTDIGRVRAGGSVTPGGVTGQDVGGGLMIPEDASKSRSTVTRDFIDKQSPTANPFQMVRMLPGVATSSADAAGLNGGGLTLRGFRTDQIGLTIEGMPVNDSGNYALYPQEYVDSENIQQVVISQGTPDLDSPHIGATGGVMNIYMRDPSKTVGGLFDFSYGTKNLTREFVRLETGQVGPFRAYFSFSNYNRDHYRGPGSDDRQHFDAKAVLDVRDHSRITASFIYNTSVNNNYLNPTLAQWQAATNYSVPNYAPTFGGSFTRNGAGVINQAANGASNYYQLRVNPFRNAIFSLPSSFALTDNLTYDVVPYVWYGFGNGGGTTTVSGGKLAVGNQVFTGLNLTNNPGGFNAADTALLYAPSITETWRPGVINKLTYQLDNHKIFAGYWFERANHHQFGPYSALNADGTPQDVFGVTNNIILPNGQKAQKRDYTTITTTNEVFAGDEMTLLNDRLTITYGIKQAWVTRNLTNALPGATSPVNLSSSATLPQVGAKFQLDDKNQVYASLGTTFRTPVNYVLADSFSTTGASAGTKTAGVSRPANETAITAEIGHRFQGELIYTSLAFFGTLYQNRQLDTSIQDPSNLGNTIGTTLNIGRVRKLGVDFEIGTRPINHFRPYFSAEFLSSRLASNISTVGTNPVTKVIGIDQLPTANKNEPGVPDMTMALGIDYDDGHIIGNATAKYVGRQYSTVINDEMIPGHGSVDAMIGYRFSDFGYLKSPEVRLNIYNLFNQRALTGVAGGNGGDGYTTNSKSTVGLGGKTISASGTPSYYVMEGFAAILTLRSAF